MDLREDCKTEEKCQYKGRQKNNLKRIYLNEAVYHQNKHRHNIANYYLKKIKKYTEEDDEEMMIREAEK